MYQFAENRSKEILRRFCDLCCNSTGMFVQSADFVEEHDGRIGDNLIQPH